MGVQKLGKYDKEYLEMRDRIFTLLKSQKISQKTFAQAIDVSPQTITDWKNGKSFSFTGMTGKIAPALHTSASWLIFGKGEKYVSDEQRSSLLAVEKSRIDAISQRLHIFEKETQEDVIDSLVTVMSQNGITAKDLSKEDFQTLTEILIKYIESAANRQDTETSNNVVLAVPESDTALPKGAEHIDLGTFHRIPILGRISAGLPLYAEQHIEGYTVTDLNSGAEYFALIVHGDSMNALGINDGYRLIVRRQDEVENGEVAVVMVGDEDATVKRFYATGDTITLMPQSTNPEHQPQIYDATKTKIRVIGKVVKVEFTL